MARSHIARGSAYVPAASRMEGGFTDRRGVALNTLQDFLEGKAKYVSVAMDKHLPLKYGATLRIKELEARLGKVIEFRVVDTGDAFDNKRYSRIDICVRNHAASFDPVINGSLTLMFD